MNIVIINGPNLNLLGKREPDIYGDLSFESFYADLSNEFPQVKLEYYQSNVEGELINIIQDAGFRADAIILNAGGYTHTSVAIGDAVAAVPSPVIEVHISNIFAREQFRHQSTISAHAIGMITGLGLEGYRLAVQFLIRRTAAD